MSSNALHSQLTLARVLPSSPGTCVHSHGPPRIRQPPHSVHHIPRQEDGLVILLIVREVGFNGFNDVDIRRVQCAISGETENSDEFVAEEFHINGGES